MYQTITRSMFHDAFRDMGRLDNFSYAGRDALFDMLESLSEDEKDIELDVIALCCEYAEDSVEQVLKDYNLEKLDDLYGATYVVWSDETTVLYQQF